MMRKTLATVASVAIMLGNVPGVLAATDTTSVINSGTDAIVNSSATENNSVVVNNNNDAKIVQTSSSVNISGQNDASNNISLPSGCGTCMTQGAGTSIVTGAATSQTSMAASANSNQTAVVLPSNGGSSSNNLGVVNTGGTLGVNASATTNNAVVVNNNNSAGVTQSANSVNISGQNTANEDIGTTTVVTGPSGSANTMGVDVNSNETVVSLGSGVLGGTGTVGCCGVPCTANNCTDVTNTGANTLVNSSATTNTAVVVNNNNRMWTNQSVFSTDISGQNTANSNIGGAGILAGPAGSSSAMSVMGNDNSTAVALGAGMPLGGNMLSVVNTGIGAVTNASANTNTASQTNNNNSLWGWQANWTFSLSGQNSALSNIGGAGVGTLGAGSASNFGVLGNANNTFVGDLMSLPLWLLAWWV